MCTIRSKIYSRFAKRGLTKLNLVRHPFIKSPTTWTIIKDYIRRGKDSVRSATHFYCSCSFSFISELPSQINITSSSFQMMLALG